MHPTPRPHRLSPSPMRLTPRAEALVVYLRAMFGHDIRAIVPELAMSARTMMACACREIVMGKHSCLGPIDPQFGGIAAHGVVESVGIPLLSKPFTQHALATAVRKLLDGG